MDRLELGNFRHRPLKLEKHHERIVQALFNGENRSRLAVELGVDRKTLYHYIRAYVDTEGVESATVDSVPQYYEFKGKLI